MVEGSGAVTVHVTKSADDGVARARTSGGRRRREGGRRGGVARGRSPGGGEQGRWRVTHCQHRGRGRRLVVQDREVRRHDERWRVAVLNILPLIRIIIGASE